LPRQRPTGSDELFYHPEDQRLCGFPQIISRGKILFEPLSYAQYCSGNLAIALSPLFTKEFVKD